MNLNNPVIINLRQQLQNLRNEVTNYKQLYRTERQDRRNQKNICQELQNRVANLLEDNDSLSNDLDMCRQHVDAFQIPKPVKKWHKLKSANAVAK